MSKLAERQIKTLLLQEAQAKHEHRKQTFVKDFLLQDAEKRVASVLKEAMPQGRGQSHLRNSGWNTVWNWSFPSARVDKIRQEIESQFSPYFYQILEGRHQPVMAGFAVSNDSKKTSDDVQDGSIYFRFAYHRGLDPLPNNNNPVQQASHDTINNAWDTLDRVLGKDFRQFRDAVKANNVPSQPYFHITTDSGSESGGLLKSKQESLFNFIRSERERHKQGIEGARSFNYYKQHEAMLNQTNTLPISHKENKTRKFSTSDIPRDATFRDLFGAIQSKVNDGYTLNTATLSSASDDIVRGKMQQYDLDPSSQDPKIIGYINTYKRFYFYLGKDIIKWFREFKKQGSIPNNANVTLEELRLALAHLTVPVSGSKHALGANECSITIRTPYYSNGWDSTAKSSNPNQRMLTIPPLVQLPDGEVRYDRGNGNLGYDHLTSNWKGGVEVFLNKWGPYCAKWYETLSMGRIDRGLSTGSREVYDAAKNVFGNRTSAENVLDILAKYPNWEDFKQNHLDKSSYGEISTVDSGLKAINAEKESGRPSSRHQFPIQGQGEELFKQIDQYGASMQQLANTNIEAAAMMFDGLNKNLISLYSSRELDWDTLTLALNKLNNYKKATKIQLDPNDKTLVVNKVGETGEAKVSKMDAKGFKNLRDFGYQTAKMMDFLSAIVTRSCKEEINHNGVKKELYGHQISGTSGKSRGGEIILSVRYAYNAKEVTQDPEIRKQINNEQRARHVRARSRLQRQTAHPQQAEPTGRFTDPNDPSTEVGVMEPFPNENAPIVTIVENVEYFLGQAAGKRRFAKTIRHGLPWRQMIDQFMIMYPDIGDQLGVIFEPMNADLQRLELSCKRAIEKVRKGVEVHYVSDSGDVEVLSGDTLRDKAVVSGDAPDDAAADIAEVQRDEQQQTWTEQYPPPTPDIVQQPPVSVEEHQPMDPIDPTQPPEKPRNMKKPMPQVNFVGKTRNQDRRLLRSNSYVQYTLGSVQDRLICSANKLDEIGESKMADKIDILLSIIQEDD